MSFGFPPQGLPAAAGIDVEQIASAVWAYPVRILTELERVRRVIENIDYANARPEDILYAPLAARLGKVSFDSLARFIEAGISRYNMLDVYASLIQQNPFNIWDTATVAKIFASSEISIDTVFALLRQLDGDTASSILYSMIDVNRLRLLDIITRGSGQLVVAAGTRLEMRGIVIRESIVIESGARLELSSSINVIVARVFINNGEVVSTGTAGYPGGPLIVGAPPTGGAGRAGIIIVAGDVRIGSISADGENGSTYYNASNYEFNGEDGGNGTFLLVYGDQPGAGGRGGAGGGAGASGGGGGGGILFYPGSGGGWIEYTFESLSSLARYIFRSVIDYFVSNVLNKQLSNPVSLPPLIGGGGGGGSAYHFNDLASGGGGGGGGQIIIIGENIDASSATVTARGGNGGDAYASQSALNLGWYAGGGGGGGGGVVYIAYYNSITGSPSIDVSGGAGGAGAPDTSGNRGEDGRPGVYRVERVQ